jgi:hypothetical protein
MYQGPQIHVLPSFLTVCLFLREERVCECVVLSREQTFNSNDVQSTANRLALSMY